MQEKLTTADEKKFTGEAVRAYVRALHRMPSPGAMVVTPPEFDKVVSAGKSSVPFLLRELSGEDEELRQAAILAIQLITNKSFGPYGNKPEDWRALAAGYQDWWQRHRMQSHVDWLIEDTHSPVLAEQRSAILQLGDYDTDKSREALRNCLSDPRVQVDAIRSLGRLGDNQVIPLLISVLLPHENPSIRKDGICLLEGLTGQTMGFNPESSASSRGEAVKRWKLWAAQRNMPNH
jgi:hypothetical protein